MGLHLLRERANHFAEWKVPNEAFYGSEVLSLHSRSLDGATDGTRECCFRAIDFAQRKICVGESFTHPVPSRKSGADS